MKKACFLKHLVFINTAIAWEQGKCSPESYGFSLQAGLPILCESNVLLVLVYAPRVFHGLFGFPFSPNSNTPNSALTRIRMTISHLTLKI